MFDSAEEYNEHELSRRHKLCVLNSDTGEKIVQELEHLYCNICKKQYQNYKEYVDHMFQEKHVALTKTNDLLADIDVFHCYVCDLNMDEKAKAEHLKDRRHLKKVHLKEMSNYLANLANQEVLNSGFECQQCNIILPDFTRCVSHFLGDSHINRLIDRTLNTFIQS